MMQGHGGPSRCSFSALSSNEGQDWTWHNWITINRGEGWETETCYDVLAWVAPSTYLPGCWIQGGFVWIGSYLKGGFLCERIPQLPLFVYSYTCSLVCSICFIVGKNSSLFLQCKTESCTKYISELSFLYMCIWLPLGSNWNVNSWHNNVCTIIVLS